MAAERILLELIRASDLIVAELDGYEFHSARHDFERDHEMMPSREQAVPVSGALLGAADIKLVRISWRQLDRADELAARLAASLGAPRRGVRVA